jgi:CRP-like cAMP-binding protein
MIKKIMAKRQFFDLPSFRGLTLAQQEQILPCVHLAHFAIDSVLFGQGDKAHSLYVLETGWVEIMYKPFDGTHLSVSQIHSGDVFGWSAALGRSGYTSTARAKMESTAYRIARRDLRCLCQTTPETGMVLLDRLTLSIATRLKCTHAEVMNILNQGMELGLDLAVQGGKNDHSTPNFF